ncbi:hypothetical protein ACTXJ3_18230 [Brachybacterium paraconglomeratum]|uniref:hypothetical protein n=1 Tax=Brachybacterium paraconglomeratum TaxID=173362 RepID=UPI003FD1D9B3
MDPQHHAHDGQRPNVHGLVDALLEHARSEHPDITDWSVALSPSESLLVPRHSDKLFRAIDGIPGYYNGHVYRDALIRGVPGWPDDWIALTTITSDATYYGHLSDGTITTHSPWEVGS